MRSRTRQPCANRPAPTNPARDSDAWTDAVADRVQSLLREDGFELELGVFYDAITEVLHAVGYDGAPPRCFRALEGDRVPGTPRNDQVGPLTS